VFLQFGWLGILFGWSKPTKPPDWLAAINLNKEEAKCELKINHNNETLPFCSELTYLGEMLDYVSPSLRKKLTSHVGHLEAASWLGCWGNNIVNSHLSPGTFNCKSTAFLSGAKAHICLIDPAINDALRTVTGSLRPTPADNHPILTSIQPAELRPQRSPTISSTPSRGSWTSTQCSPVHRVGMNSISEWPCQEQPGSGSNYLRISVRCFHFYLPK